MELAGRQYIPIPYTETTNKKQKNKK